MHLVFQDDTKGGGWMMGSLLITMGVGKLSEGDKTWDELRITKLN